MDAALGVSGYTAPISMLGKIRSAGITDLRHGNVVDADWRGRDRFAIGDRRRSAVRLPRNVRCHAIAGSTARTAALPGWLAGDGLVTVDSALGHDTDPRRALRIPEARCWIARGVGHNGLLGDAAVYERIRDWLA